MRTPWYHFDMEGMRTPRKRPFDEVLARAEASGAKTSGKEKHVYDHPEDPARVISVAKKGAESESEGRGHLQQFVLIRILHLLYPQTVPDAYDVASRSKLLVRDKVEGTHFSRVRHTLDYHFGIAGEKGREEFGDEMTKLGLNIDYWPRNFKKSGENVAYLDSFVIREPAEYVAAQLKKAIHDRLRGTDRARALHFLDRFGKLSDRGSTAT